MYENTDGGSKMLVREQKEAVRLRKRGHSYREILKRIPVAKSTLSLWLRRVGLSKRQEQRLTLKRLEAGRRGAQARRNQRVKITEEIKNQARAEILYLNLGEKELWLMGTMLYWAEGKKEKDSSSSGSVRFSNSDPFMLKLFRKWLADVCNVSEDRIIYELYVHVGHKHRLAEVQKYWSDILGIGRDKLQRVYYKRHSTRTKRAKIGNSYFGQLMICVKASTSLNRKIAGWIEGIIRYWGIV
jgi:transposase